MVSVQSVKQLIVIEVGKLKNLTDYDIIIISAVVYMIYNQHIAMNTNISRNMSSYIESTVNNVFSNLIEKKEKYATYTVLKNYVIGLNKSNFLTLTETELNKVYNKFNENILKVNFSTKVFKVEMYNITEIPHHLALRLSDTHFNIMCPIIQYYKDRFGIPIENMAVSNVDEIEGNPGKMISFSIGGISSSTVVNDFRNKVFGLEHLLYKSSVKNELVNIIIK